MKNILCWFGWHPWSYLEIEPIGVNIDWEGRAFVCRTVCLRCNMTGQEVMSEFELIRRGVDFEPKEGS